MTRALVQEVNDVSVEIEVPVLDEDEEPREAAYSTAVDELDKEWIKNEGKIGHHTEKKNLFGQVNRTNVGLINSYTTVDWKDSDAGQDDGHRQDVLARAKKAAKGLRDQGCIAFAVHPGWGVQAYTTPHHATSYPTGGSVIPEQCMHASSRCPVWGYTDICPARMAAMSRAIECHEGLRSAMVGWPCAQCHPT